jgi:adenosine kinase
MNLIITGTLSFDYIMDFRGRFADRIMPEKIHKISLSFLVETLTKQFGGTAGNIAYTLKLLGVSPTILAPAGSDFEEYKKFLESKKISTKSIAIQHNVKTSSYFVVTDTDDNQIGSFYLGATKFAKKLTIPNHADFVVLAPTDPPAMKKYIGECRGLPYMYDPAFQIGNFTADELHDGITGAKILIGNDYEIALIEQKLGVSHEELIVMVPVLITTLGAKGSIIETRREAIHIKPAKPKNTSDPTGAGDAYRAGFLAGYLKKYDLQICGQMGSVAAAYTVETYGTQTHNFTKNEYIRRYKENFNDDLDL